MKLKSTKKGKKSDLNLWDLYHEIKINCSFKLFKKKMNNYLANFMYKYLVLYILYKKMLKLYRYCNY